jgi:hypothetical protein
MKIDIGMRKAYHGKTDLRAVCLRIDFDPDGNVVNSFGDSKIFPNVPHGCTIDHENNFWTAGNGDGIIQKYGCDGNYSCRSAKEALSIVPAALCWSMSVTGKVTGSKFSVRWQTSRTTFRERTSFQKIGAPHGGSVFRPTGSKNTSRSPDRCVYSWPHFGARFQRQSLCGRNRLRPKSPKM